MNPYFNNIVVSGFEKDQAFLGSVDLYGNFIVKDYVVAGFAKHFGLALIANEWDTSKSFEQERLAQALLGEASISQPFFVHQKATSRRPHLK